MASFPLALVLLLAGGILYGLTVCNLTCGPILATRLGSRARGWKDGAFLAIVYSIPRIAVMMIFGALVGGAGGLASDLMDRGIVTMVQAVSYLLIGILMVVSGIGHARGFRSCGRKGLLDRIVALAGPKGGRSERAYMTMLGLLFSLACFGEAWVVMTASTVGTSLGSGTALGGALLGMAGMASFSIGLSIPAIALSAFASEAGRRYDLSTMLRSAGYVLVGLGALIILFEALALIGRIT